MEASGGAVWYSSFDQRRVGGPVLGGGFVVLGVPRNTIHTITIIKISNSLTVLNILNSLSQGFVVV